MGPISFAVNALTYIQEVYFKVIIGHNKASAKFHAYICFRVLNNHWFNLYLERNSVVALYENNN